MWPVKQSTYSNLLSICIYNYFTWSFHWLIFGWVVLTTGCDWLLCVYKLNSKLLYIVHLWCGPYSLFLSSVIQQLSSLPVSPSHPPSPTHTQTHTHIYTRRHTHTPSQSRSLTLWGACNSPAHQSLLHLSLDWSFACDRALHNLSHIGEHLTITQPSI